MEKIFIRNDNRRYIKKVKRGIEKMDKRNEWKLNELPELEKKDIYKPVYLNKYGYYELRRQNTREERNANFEEHYFQEYSGATYEKVEYPPEELKYLNNQIEERAYVIEQNLAKTGVSGDYSLLDIGCGEGFLLQYFHDKGKKVKGIDIGSYALEHFHPDMLLPIPDGYVKDGILKKEIWKHCFLSWQSVARFMM